VTYFVHDPKEGQNARYDNGEMLFGDGDEESYPVVAPSVVAHEMSHGFTEQHANLVYEYQSGGMDESFSDMADKSVEYYVNGKNNWNIDAELLKPGGRMLRYMDDPTKDCYDTKPLAAKQDIAGGKPHYSSVCSIDNVKDYTSKTDPHHSSGIFNKAFYLIASKLDTRQAFAIMVKANMDYWTSNATFAHGACGAMKAARDLKYDVKIVRDAMRAVGVSTKKCKVNA
jgi:Zn-dependent metalloprotease